MWPWMKVMVNIVNTWCIIMSDTVTLARLTTMTSTGSEESLAREIHTQTYTHTQTRSRLSSVKFAQSRTLLHNERVIFQHSWDTRSTSPPPYNIRLSPSTVCKTKVWVFFCSPVQFSSVQFHWKWYLSVRESPYALRPVSRKFPQCCYWSCSNVGPIDNVNNRPVSSFQGKSSTSPLTFFYVSLLTGRSMVWNVHVLGLRARRLGLKLLNTPDLPRRKPLTFVMIGFSRRKSILFWRDDEPLFLFFDWHNNRYHSWWTFSPQAFWEICTWIEQPQSTLPSRDKRNSETKHR